MARLETLSVGDKFILGGGVNTLLGKRGSGTPWCRIYNETFRSEKEILGSEEVKLVAPAGATFCRLGLTENPDGSWTATVGGDVASGKTARPEDAFPATGRISRNKKGWETFHPENWTDRDFFVSIWVKGAKSRTISGQALSAWFKEIAKRGLGNTIVKALPPEVLAEVNETITAGRRDAEKAAFAARWQNNADDDHNDIHGPGGFHGD